jgi:hypothetical protein
MIREPGKDRRRGEYGSCCAADPWSGSRLLADVASGGEFDTLDGGHGDGGGARACTGHAARLAADMEVAKYGDHFRMTPLFRLQ